MPTSKEVDAPLTEVFRFVIVSDATRNGPQGAASQTPVLSKSNLDGYFVTAEECVKRFPQRLKEVFRVNYDLSTAWLIWTPPHPTLLPAIQPHRLGLLEPRHALRFTGPSAPRRRLRFTPSPLPGEGGSGLTLQSPPSPEVLPCSRSAGSAFCLSKTLEKCGRRGAGQGVNEEFGMRIRPSYPRHPFTGRQVARPHDLLEFLLMAGDERGGPSPVSDADGKQIVQTHGIACCRRNDSMPWGHREKTPLRRTSWRRWPLNRILNPQQVLARERKAQTIGEGACPRQVVDRSWSWALGKSSQIARVGCMWKL